MIKEITKAEKEFFLLQLLNQLQVLLLAHAEVDLYNQQIPSENKVVPFSQ